MLTARPLLFFDLDGPLLDVGARYHGVYAAIAGELGVRPLGREEYWAAKRQRLPLEKLFPGFPAGVRLRQLYLEHWLAWIEAPEWLSMDTLAPDAHACLETLGRSHTLYLVTLRRQATTLGGQLEALGLRRYFHQVFSGWAEGAEAARLKASWMRPLLADGSATLVGDSEVDMHAALSLGMRAIGVSFGIREARELTALGAERVIEGLRELPLLLHGSPQETGRTR
jgi:phosphoglycolate phosphatase-like HAD superfamily hydrolase